MGTMSHDEINHLYSLTVTNKSRGYTVKVPETTGQDLFVYDNIKLDVSLARYTLSSTSTISKTISPQITLGPNKISVKYNNPSNHTLSSTSSGMLVNDSTSVPVSTYNGTIAFSTSGGYYLRVNSVTRLSSVPYTCKSVSGYSYFYWAPYSSTTFKYNGTNYTLSDGGYLWQDKDLVWKYKSTASSSQTTLGSNDTPYFSTGPDIFEVQVEIY